MYTLEPVSLELYPRTQVRPVTTASDDTPPAAASATAFTAAQA
ncbi:hypothetical protein ABH935_000365 [Catenulispora sp. GAS73]